METKRYVSQTKKSQVFVLIFIVIFSGYFGVVNLLNWIDGKGLLSLIFATALLFIALSLSYLLIRNKNSEIIFEYDENGFKFGRLPNLRIYRWDQIDELAITNANGQPILRFISSDESIKASFLIDAFRKFGAKREILGLFLNNFPIEDKEEFVKELVVLVDENQRSVVDNPMEVKGNEYGKGIFYTLIAYVVSILVYVILSASLEVGVLFIVLAGSYVINATLNKYFDFKTIVSRILIGLFCASQLLFADVIVFMINASIPFNVEYFIQIIPMYVEEMIEMPLDFIYDYLTIAICFYIGFKNK